MDVRLPDGTVIQNVPDGITKAELAGKLKANGYDISKLAPQAESRPQPANAGLLNFGASLAGLPVDTAENVLNLARAAYGVARGAVTGQPGDSPEPLRNSFGGSESIRNMLRSTGQPGLSPDNPNPQSPTGTLAYDLTSRGGFMPGGVIPAVGSVVAEKIGGPEWAGVGAMAPAAVGQVVKGAVTRTPQQQAEIDANTRAFKEANVTPSAGQATQSNFLQGFENLLSKFPGGQGIFRKFAENQQEKLASNTRTVVSAEDAGRAIEGGVKDFVTRTKDTWLALDQKLADKVASTKNYFVPPVKTQATLEELTKVMPGAEKTTAALVNPKIAQIKEAFMADVKGNLGGIPFEAIRQLRTKVGSMLDDSLISGIPNGELKKLYGALSEDMKSAAKALGAEQEFTRQSNFYKARMDRLESLNRVIGDTPEATFRRFLPKNAEEATTQRQVLRSIPAEDRATVADAVVNRLGRAKSGKQDDVGGVFSSETFLTNWNNMSPGAKAQLFPDTDMRKNLDAVAKISSNIRDGSKVFANPSGSAGAGAAYGIGAGAIAGAVASMNPVPVVAAVSLVSGANVTSRMLTNPKFVEWLAKAGTTAPENQAAHLARLGVIFNSAKDDAMKQDLGNYVSSINGR